MPSITIHVQDSDVADLSDLFQIERDLFPGEQLIQRYGDGYTLELDADRARFTFEYLRNLPEWRQFVPFPTWREDDRRQAPLEFPTRAP